VRTLTLPEQFVAQVGLRLPRRPQPPAWSQVLRTGWKLAPLGLVGAWAFAQAVVVVAAALLVVLRLGVGGDVVSGLLPGLQQGGWWNELLDLSSAGLSDVLRVGGDILSSGGPLGWGIVLYLAVLFVLGVLYWSWMASWWARRRHHQRV
jgi:hypothetical protein